MSGTLWVERNWSRGPAEWRVFVITGLTAKPVSWVLVFVLLPVHLIILTSAINNTHTGITCMTVPREQVPFSRQ